MTSEGGGSNNSDGGKLMKKVLGLGYWVQGFRCVPKLAVNFFLKDGFNVNPSTFQLLQDSANLPNVVKPLYGLISDSCYISGQHRIPYIAFGAFLQALSWLALAISPSNISILNIFIYLFLSNLGASITEVANEAIVVEMSQQSPPSFHSFVWIASAVGGILGNLLGGIFIGRFSPQSIFLLFSVLLSLQLFITISVRESSLRLPMNPSVGIRRQLFELSTALRRPEIAYSILWFALSYAIIPALTGTMFFYQTQYLQIDSSILGISKLFGQVTMFIWGNVYENYLTFVPPRKLISIIQATLAFSMISDSFFVRGFYRQMGIPDTLYVVFFLGFSDALFFFKILPFKALISQLCPPGCEGSIMAFLASTISLAFIVGGYLGVFLASCIKITASDFSGFPLALVIQATCTLLPIFWSSY